MTTIKNRPVFLLFASLVICFLCCTMFINAYENQYYIGGDCWKGEECKDCSSDNVGSINGIPVCCEECEKSGLAIGPHFCECLHNGP